MKKLYLILVMLCPMGEAYPALRAGSRAFALLKRVAARTSALVSVGTVGTAALAAQEIEPKATDIVCSEEENSTKSPFQITIKNGAQLLETPCGILP